MSVKDLIEGIEQWKAARTLDDHPDVYSPDMRDLADKAEHKIINAIKEIVNGN